MMSDATGVLSKAPTLPEAAPRGPEAEGAGRRPAEAPFAWVLARLTQPGGLPGPVPQAEGPAIDPDAVEPGAAPVEAEAEGEQDPPPAGDDGLDPAQPPLRPGLMDLVVATLATLQPVARGAMPDPPASPAPDAADPAAAEAVAAGPWAPVAGAAPDRSATAGPTLPEGRVASARIPPVASGPEAGRLAAQIPKGSLPPAGGDETAGMAPPAAGTGVPPVGPARPAPGTSPAAPAQIGSAEPVPTDGPILAGAPAPRTEAGQAPLIQPPMAMREGRFRTTERPADPAARQATDTGPPSTPKPPAMAPMIAAAQPAGPGPEAGAATGPDTAPGPEALRHGGPDMALPGAPSPASVTDAPRTTGPAQQVAQQVAQSLGSLPPRPAAGGTVVSLAPAELGRVTIRLDPDPQSPVLHLTVERPETLELMRRNIDVLESALRDLGRGDCTIQLDGRGDGAMAGRRESGAAPAPSGAAADTPRTAQTAPEPRATAASGRLDLRL